MMKKFTLFTFLAIVVLFVSSCKKDQATDAADQYVGNYASQTGNWGDFAIAKVDASTILIAEIASSDNWKVTATVSGNNLVVASQDIDGYNTSGTGSKSGNTITLNLTENSSHHYSITLIKK
ncbi:MAG TPA: hypothetical protein VIK10_05505 [Prolixibacteraceae bacterium]